MDTDEGSSEAKESKEAKEKVLVRDLKDRLLIVNV